MPATAVSSWVVYETETVPSLPPVRSTVIVAVWPAVTVAVDAANAELSRLLSGRRAARGYRGQDRLHHGSTLTKVFTPPATRMSPSGSSIPLSRFSSSLRT